MSAKKGISRIDGRRNESGQIILCLTSIIPNPIITTTEIYRDVLSHFITEYQ